MYARVALASNSLSTPGLPTPTANLVHKSLLDQINAHGRLVFSNDPELLALVRAIKSGADIPQDARNRWVETLTRLQKHGRIRVLKDRTPLADVTVLEQLRADWGTCADVAVVASDACEPLGIPPEVGLVSTPGTLPDVAIPAAASSSPAMERLRTLASVSYAASGTARDDFWHAVLEPLAMDAKAVSVLDAYLFKSIWDVNYGRHWTRRWRAEQLAWLLEHLDRVVARGAEVQLIGNAHGDYPDVGAAETAEAIRDHWRPHPQGRLAAVRVSLAEPQRGERFPHDRHIRFSTGGAIEISAGLDRLREDTIRDPDGMKWKYIWNTSTLRALQTAEARAKSYAPHRPAAVIIR